MQHLQQSCLDHGCYALNQLQCLLRVGGQADSVLERLLIRLDEQGLALSSPWPQREGRLIAAAVWPKVCEVWTEKQKWAGCRELGEELAAQWLCVKHCLSACRKLGKARILTVQRLRSASGQTCSTTTAWCQLTSTHRSPLGWMLLNPADGLRRSHTNTYSYSQHLSPRNGIHSLCGGDTAMP